MKIRLKVPKHAKISAKKGLKLRSSLPKSKRFGIDKNQAKKLGIASGVERAKQLIRSKSISYTDANKVCNFGNRFKNCKTSKCEGAHLIWGGRKFEKKACKFIKENKG